MWAIYRWPGTFFIMTESKKNLKSEIKNAEQVNNKIS